MDIYVFNPSVSAIIGVISIYKSIIWSLSYSGADEFELTVPATEENLKYLKEGYYLIRDKDLTNTYMNHVMVISKMVIRISVEDGWMITISGKGLKSIVGDRIIWERISFSGNVENLIRKVITDNLISSPISARNISGFQLEAANGFPETTEMQLFGENIEEWLNEMCNEYKYGWDVVLQYNWPGPSPLKYYFRLYKGTDRTWDSDTPVVFSPKFDNLLSSEYTQQNLIYKNAARVGGEGEGADQVLEAVTVSDGRPRKEIYIDANSMTTNGVIITEHEYREMLKNYGKNQLAQTAVNSQTLTANIVANGTYKYNEDYFLGDIVQIENDVGIKATSRITEVIEAEDENGTSIVPTFSEMEVS